MAISQWDGQVEAYVAQVQLGNRAAFEKLYHLTSGKLFALVLRMLADKEIAADILQESYLKVWRSAGSYRADLGGAWAWMCQVVRNTALDRLRQQARQPGFEGDEVIGQVSGADSNTWLERHDLDKCLDEIKEQPRTAIVLAYMYGMSHQELQERLGAPLGTLKSWIRRGLQELNRCLHA